jgi:hypothetical protein
MPDRDYDSANDINARVYEEVEREVKTRRRYFWPSGDAGSMIINAATGVPTGDRVGSFDSLKYYEVVDATGYYNNKGYLVRAEQAPNKDPIHLFYDSPEQADMHRRRKADLVHNALWHYKLSYFFPTDAKNAMDGVEQRYKHWNSLNTEERLKMAGLHNTTMNMVSEAT